MTSPKKALESGLRRSDLPPLRGGKPYTSPIRPHRRAVRKWREDGATCQEIATQLDARGVKVSSEAVRKFLARAKKRRPVNGTPQPIRVKEQPAPDTRAVTIMDPKKLVLHVTRPTPPPPKQSPAPTPPRPDYLKPENQSWHADYKPRSTEGVSHTQTAPKL